MHQCVTTCDSPFLPNPHYVFLLTIYVSAIVNLSVPEQVLSFVTSGMGWGQAAEEMKVQCVFLYDHIPPTFLETAIVNLVLQKFLLFMTV